MHAWLFVVSLFFGVSSWATEAVQLSFDKVVFSTDRGISVAFGSKWDQAQMLRRISSISISNGGKPIRLPEAYFQEVHSIHYQTVGAGYVPKSPVTPKPVLSLDFECDAYSPKRGHERLRALIVVDGDTVRSVRFTTKDGAVAYEKH